MTHTLTGSQGEAGKLPLLPLIGRIFRRFTKDDYGPQLVFHYGKM